MNVLYEEDGEFKVGSVLATNPASLHVQSPHGRRSKIKAAQVLVRFEQPSAAELLASAEKYAAELDTPMDDREERCAGEDREELEEVLATELLLAPAAEP